MSFLYYICGLLPYLGEKSKCLIGWFIANMIIDWSDGGVFVGSLSNQRVSGAHILSLYFIN